MPGKSKHYQDVHFWILSVIKSCNNLQQLTTAEKLIETFQSYCNNYITKKAAQWIIGLLVSIFTAGIFLWDAIVNSHK